MTSPNHIGHQEELPLHFELGDVHANAEEVGHPAGRGTREALSVIDNENRVSRGAMSLEATTAELHFRLLQEYADRNDAMLRNGGRPRIPIGLVAVRLGDEGIMTREQAGRAIDLYEQNRRQALAEAAIHEQDWAERAAHDRRDG